MKPTNEAVYDALTTLQNLCSETENCSDCPLSIDDSKECGVLEYEPKDWELRKVGHWKAFE